MAGRALGGGGGVGGGIGGAVLGVVFGHPMNNRTWAAGLGAQADSWASSGPNRPVVP